MIEEKESEDGSEVIMTEKAGRDGTVVMCGIFAFLFLVISLGLAAVLVFLVINNDLNWTLSSKPEEPVLTSSAESSIRAPDPNNPSVFDELTWKELKGVRDYVIANETLNITDANRATLDTSHIFSIELQMPTKTTVLEALEGASRPPRYAVVVLIRGDQNPPTVEEYQVGPLPKPNEINFLRNRPWLVRPRRGPGDLRGIQSRLAVWLEPLYPLLKQKFGFGFHNCTSKPNECLQWTFSAPPFPQGSNRNTWIILRQPYAGEALHALPLYLHINDTSNLPQQWTVLRVRYMDRSYNTIEDLASAHELGLFGNIPAVSNKDSVTLTSSEQDRVSSEPKYSLIEEKAAPETLNLGGRRYKVDGHKVTYMGWQFDFNYKISTGLQVFDARFRGERILYELSLQGVMSYYAGNNPFMMHARFLEDLDLLISSSTELMPGVDCPRHADFFDTHYFNNVNGNIMRKKRHVCLFEHDTNFPLKRHYHGTSGEKFKYFSGISRKVLVLRTIQVFRDTDFIFDYCFYGNGAVEVKYATTGYVTGTFWSDKYPTEEAHGYPVSEFQLSPIAQHMVNFKVDLDIHGQRNTHQVDLVSMNSRTNPYFPKQEIMQKRITRTIKSSETEAMYKFDAVKPSFLLFYSERAKNRFGKNRAYRIHLNNALQNLQQERWKWENGVSWARHQVAVTKRKEEESTSSSFYNAMNPYTPEVDFSDYLDGESIEDEDLVAWVTLGNHRLPSTSDVPLASTLDTESSFKLLPFNYFDDDVTKTLPDYIHATPFGEGARIHRKPGTKSEDCVKSNNDITFEGKDD